MEDYPGKEKLPENPEQIFQEKIEELLEDSRDAKIAELNDEIEKKDKIIEDTQKELDTVREALKMSPQSELPSSIAIEQDSVSKLKQEKSALEDESTPEAAEKDIVSEIENLAMTSDQHKAELLLTREGIKPASTLSFNFDPSKRELVDQYIASIAALGMPTKAIFEGNGVDIFIGSTEEKLSEVINARESHDKEKFGIALGIPETATEAFVGKIEKLDPIPEEIKNSDAMVFSPTLILSKEHWEEELKTGQERADYIKKTSPKLYEQYKEWRLKSK